MQIEHLARNSCENKAPFQKSAMGLTMRLTFVCQLTTARHHMKSVSMQEPWTHENVTVIISAIFRLFRWMYMCILIFVC